MNSTNTRASSISPPIELDGSRVCRTSARKKAESPLRCVQCSRLLMPPKKTPRASNSSNLSPLSQCDAQLDFIKNVVWLKSIITKGDQISKEEFRDIFQDSKENLNSMFEDLGGVIEGDEKSFFQEEQLSKFSLKPLRNCDADQDRVSSSNMNATRPSEGENESRVIFENETGDTVSGRACETNIICDQILGSPLTPQRIGIMQSNQFPTKFVVSDSDNGDDSLELSFGESDVKDSGMDTMVVDVDTESTIANMQVVCKNSVDETSALKERRDAKYEVISREIKGEGFRGFDLTEIGNRGPGGRIGDHVMSGVFERNVKPGNSMQGKLEGMNRATGNVLNIAEACNSNEVKEIIPASQTRGPKKCTILEIHTGTFVKFDKSSHAFWMKGNVADRATLPVDVPLRQSREKSFQRKRSRWCPEDVTPASLRFTLSSSKAREVLLSAVKNVLKALENEKLGTMYLTRKRWVDSLEKEAVEAIVNVIRVGDVEKLPNDCSKAASESIQRMFDAILDCRESGKEISWEHHISIVLEICESFAVCKETIQLMIRKMKSLFSENDKPPETLENASAAEDVQNQLYWIFHGLEICLRKYEVLSSDQREVVGDNEPQFVTDSWKRLWKNGKKCGQRKNLEEEWISVLEEIMMANLDNCTLISTQAWQCLNILREIQDRKKTVTEGINYT